MRVNGGPLLTIMVVRSWWWLLLGRGNHPRWYQCTFYVWFCACVCFQKAPLQFWKRCKQNGGYELCCIFYKFRRKEVEVWLPFLSILLLCSLWWMYNRFSIAFFMQICTSCSEEDYQPLMWHQRYLLIFQFQIILVFESLSIQAASISEAGKLPQLQSSQLGSEDKWAETHSWTVHLFSRIILMTDPTYDRYE